jgi:hypothetical protein
LASRDGGFLLSPQVALDRLITESVGRKTAFVGIKSEKMAPTIKPYKRRNCSSSVDEKMFRIILRHRRPQ